MLQGTFCSFHYMLIIHEDVGQMPKLNNFLSVCWTFVQSLYIVFVKFVSIYYTESLVTAKETLFLFQASEKRQSVKSGLSENTRSRKPFSMCEERRLKRGILKYGCNWKTILKNMNFAKDRTAEDLRNKWRSTHRKK